jgi:hypothetical protein
VRFLWMLALVGCDEVVEARTGRVVSVEFGGGLCAYGACSSILWLDTGREVTLDGFESDGTPWSNDGDLTDEGLSTLASIEIALEGQTFDAVYGCPGCDDGGLVVVELTDGDGTVTTTYAAGEAPTGLEDLDALATDVFVALRSCVADDLLEPLGTCSPQE